MSSRKILLGILAVISQEALAQPQDLTDLSLEELMDVKVTVATDTEKSLREAPGIISVISDEQIKLLGARDLMEVLATVPGITFGHDVLGNVSIIMRGIWAQEGRILLLIDGMEMNDRSYGTLQLANHFPAEHIKRVEIIRGPGSAIYGGFAELGVINVITKNGSDIDGGSISTSYSRTDKDFGQQMTNFMLGKEVDKIKFSVKGMYNDSNFSDRKYTDENGTSASLSGGNSKITNQYLNFRGSYDKFYVNYIKDNYRTENILLWGDLENNPGSGNIRKPVPKEYPTDVYQLGFHGDVSEKVNLHLYYQDKVQLPYFQPDTKNEVEYANSWRRKIERKVYGLKTKYTFTDHLNLSVGAEHSEDKSIALNRLNYSGSPDTFGNGSNRYQITNTALFSQLDLSSDFANVTAGLRYDSPSVSDKTLVPRVGVTKVMGNSHVKALFAQAFRAPVIENISLNKDIEPEITTTAELEYGYQFSKSITWNINFFSTQVDDIIVYSYDTMTSTEHYNNYDRVKTLGVETDLHVKKGIHDVRFNYSTYKVDQLKADPFKTSMNSSSLIGAPRHKFHLSDLMKLTNNLSLSPSLTYLKDTSSYAWTGDQFAQKKLADQFIANIYLNYSNLFFKGLEAGAGMNNILNSAVYYAQPYVKEGDYRAGAYPGQSREYIVRLGYSKDF